MVTMEKRIKELRKEIIAAFSEEILNSFPEGERDNYRNIKVFPIALLVKADWNYKQENEGMSAKLRANIARNGQIENIHLRELPDGRYEVINGNHRYDEMVALGKQTVLAYDHGKCSLEEAIRRCLETNETFFEKDDLRLAGLIKQLNEAFEMEGLVETMPYTAEDMEHYLHLEDFDFAKYEKKAVEFNVTDDGTKKLVIRYTPEAVGIVEEIGRLISKYPGAKIV